MSAPIPFARRSRGAHTRSAINRLAQLDEQQASCTSGQGKGLRLMSLPPHDKVALHASLGLSACRSRRGAPGRRSERRR